MAYFSNGSEGEVFDEECAECILGEQPCPIFLVQSEFNYKACNDPIGREILNCLVTQDENRNYQGCQMKKLLDSIDMAIG